MKIESLAEEILAKNMALDQATNALATADRQIMHLDAELFRMKADLETNVILVATHKREIEQLQTREETLNQALEEHRQALATVQDRLQQAYVDIKRQNESIRQAIAQRDELLAEVNASRKDRNEVVAKYNELVRQLEEKNKPALQRK